MLTPKACQVCGKNVPTARADGRKYSENDYARMKNCSPTCRGISQRKDRPSDSKLEKRARAFLKSECEWCATTVKLQVHHIDHNKANNAPENLMTLCVSCHTKWHWQHGKKQRNRRFSGLRQGDALNTSGSLHE